MQRECNCTIRMQYKLKKEVATILKSFAPFGDFKPEKHANMDVLDKAH